MRLNSEGRYGQWVVGATSQSSQDSFFFLFLRQALVHVECLPRSSLDSRFPFVKFGNEKRHIQCSPELD